MSLPRSPGFRTWVAAETASTLGDSVSFFAIAWASTGLGPGVAGVVLTLESIPLAGLMLLGGATADRRGIRHTMLACDVAMTGVMALGAVLVTVTGGRRSALMLTLAALAVLSGTAAAMRRPAAGVFPRLFVDAEELPRLLATLAIFAQLVRVSGPPVAGLLIALIGVPGTLGIDAVSFGLVAAALVLVAPPRPERDDGNPEPGPALLAIVASVHRARRTPGVPSTLVAVVGLAASVLSFVMIVVPAAGHHRHWGAATTGLVSAGWVLGGLVVTAVVARRGTFGPGAVRVGPLLGAGGMVVAGLATAPLYAFWGVVLVGTGTSLTTTWLLPTFQLLTPTEMLARFQALLQLAQTGSTLVALPLLGILVARAGSTAGALVTASLLLLTAAAVTFVPRRRDAEMPAHPTS